jgi:dephospho-CoA kinase
MQNDECRTKRFAFQSWFCILHSSFCIYMFRGKPIIGIAGGIGSGKSFVARLFGEFGCCVIHADEQVKSAYNDPAITAILRSWWGKAVFHPDGNIDRAAVARIIFNDPQQRQRLEELLHPYVTAARNRVMAEAADDPAVKAFVWDTPLLFEVGSAGDCDAIVFVDAPEELRFKRVHETRGWDAAEIIRREKLQWPLDKKQRLAHDIVVNTADAVTCRSHVREILSRILAN